MVSKNFIHSTSLHVRIITDPKSVVQFICGYVTPRYVHFHNFIRHHVSFKFQFSSKVCTKSNAACLNVMFGVGFLFSEENPVPDGVQLLNTCLNTKAFSMSAVSQHVTNTTSFRPRNQDLSQLRSPRTTQGSMRPAIYIRKNNTFNRPSGQGFGVGPH